jgi:hypothetical protein
MLTTHTNTPPALLNTSDHTTAGFSPSLTPGEVDMVRQQIRLFWNAPVGAKDAEHLIINLRLKLAADGSVQEVQLAEDQARYASDSFFAAAADAAIRAVKRASPLKGLPADKFSAWGDMELTFDPKDM